MEKAGIAFPQSEGRKQHDGTRNVMMLEKKW
jgi:hypothetical protein